MTGFRWKTVDDGSPALFGVDELVTPVRGTGRMSDLEFLHVTAKRILNHVPSGSRAPTDWTINVYRGCSHACVYCLDGDTPILMADGRTKPISNVRAGDRVYGTVRVGSYRRYTVTEVQDQWRTVSRAYRVTLADGTSIVCGEDHRFLTERGWTFVGPDDERPSLTTEDVLLGPGPRLPCVMVGSAVENRPRHRASGRVAAIEDLGHDQEMVDLTTGTGDFVAAGMVSHNCFARPTHEYLGLDTGRDFDTKIVVKVNAVEKLRAELAAPSWRHERVAMGTNTDPYQRAEAKYRLTRGVLEALADHGTPFSILTKSPLVTRDLDVLLRAAERTDVEVNFSIGTLDQRVWRASEPGTPNPRRRVAAMAELARAGIRTGALVAPVLPGLSDRPEQLREVVDAVRDAGGRLLGLGALYLRPGVKEHVLDWLRRDLPELHDDWARRYGGSAYAPPHYLDELYRRAGVDRGSVRGFTPRSSAVRSGAAGRPAAR